MSSNNSELKADNVNQLAVDIIAPINELISSSKGNGQVEGNQINKQEEIVGNVNLTRTVNYHGPEGMRLDIESFYADYPENRFKMYIEHRLNGIEPLVIDVTSESSQTGEIEKWALFVTKSGCFYYWTQLKSAPNGVTAQEAIYSSPVPNQGEKVILTLNSLQVWNNPHIQIAGVGGRIALNWNTHYKEVDLEQVERNVGRPTIPLTNFSDVISAAYKGYYGYPDAVNPNLYWGPAKKFDTFEANYFLLDHKPVVRLDVTSKSEDGDFREALNDFVASLRTNHPLTED